jgi:hypothetical protein
MGTTLWLRHEDGYRGITELRPAVINCGQARVTARLSDSPVVQSAAPNSMKSFIAPVCADPFGNASPELRLRRENDLPADTKHVRVSQTLVTSAGAPGLYAILVRRLRVGSQRRRPTLVTSPASIEAAS